MMKSTVWLLIKGLLLKMWSRMVSVAKQKEFGRPPVVQGFRAPMCRPYNPDNCFIIGPPSQ